MTDTSGGVSKGAGQLLDVKEQLQGNLSSHQIEILLDRFLYGALEPIVKTTDLIERVLSSVLVQQHSDHRRKISSIDRQHLFDLAMVALNSRDTETRWKAIRKMHLERTIWIQTIKLFYSITDGYLNLENQYVQTKDLVEKSSISGEMYQIERKLGASRTYLGAAIRWSWHNYNLYHNFKHMVIEKYIRHVWNEANKSAAGTGLMIDRDDLFKNMIIGVNRAIDKYNSKSGTLTSYINQWLMNAKTNPEFPHQYGHSYTISATGRKRLVEKQEKGESGESNWAQPLDDFVQYRSYEPGAEQNVIKNIENNMLLSLSSRARDNDAALIILDIPYVLDEKQKERLRSRDEENLRLKENTLKELISKQISSE